MEHWRKISPTYFLQFEVVLFNQIPVWLVFFLKKQVWGKTLDCFAGTTTRCCNHYWSLMPQSWNWKTKKSLFQLPSLAKDTYLKTKWLSSTSTIKHKRSDYPPPQIKKAKPLELITLIALAVYQCLSNYPLSHFLWVPPVTTQNTRNSIELIITPKNTQLITCNP